MSIGVRFEAKPASALSGALRVPGDKSISHRAVLFSAMAEGVSSLKGVLDSADVRSTVAAVRALGARPDLSGDANGGLAGTIEGWGSRGPVSGDAPIDCGNSGTTARLLMGVLAGWPHVDVELRGDASLSSRPMRRVTGPLEAMGADFTDTDGTLPVRVFGSELQPANYESPVASAQVKTAILLAGLRATGRTTVQEPAASRDHTERMLPAFGVPVGVDPGMHTVWVDGPIVPRAASVDVPADPSSAAFIAAAAVLVPDSLVTLIDVALNPTRIGWVNVLDRMGADIRVTPAPVSGGEPIGTLTVRHTSGLQATHISPAEVPSLIDEIPILAVVAARAEGTTVFEGVAELRVKESDRLAAIEQGLAALGVNVEATRDTLQVSGGAGLEAATLDSLGDHRLAMAWAVAGMARSARAPGVVAVERFEAVDVSYPGFVADLSTLGAW